MKLFNNITIIGVGLIGGSIGLAIRKKHLAGSVTGVFRRKSTLIKALNARAVDRATLSVRDGVRDADLVIVATPVYMIPVVMSEVCRFAKKGAVLTDVGSTKSWILNKVDGYSRKRKDVSFVGSHPMAGSEKAGVESARSDLMQGAACIVTRSKNTNKKAIKLLSKFWSSIGCAVSVMSPAEHDRAVSLISHLPHIVAFSLAGAVPAKELKYAAEGFKDTTRVASSDPYLWSDILMTNRKEIIAASRSFTKYYNKILSALARRSYKDTVRALAMAKAKRDGFYGKTR